ncbi:MAG: DUF4013 domain-containing protein [Candidatus Bathyarchaeota archaeon]|nr:DUF4013 domain-containing protein [Candidatus Bathyarchaeum sp.]
MKLDENLSKAINYTTMLFSDLGRLLILIILDIIPIVNFVVLGYIGNVIKQPKNSEELPPLEKYFDLWVQGLKIAVAAFIFMIIPLLLIGPFVFLVALSWLEFSFLSSVGWVLAIPLMLIGVLLAFFFGILLSMAIVNMLKKDSFGEVFAFGKILVIIGKVGWGTYILWLLVIFVCSAVVAAMGGLPAVGWFLSLIVAPVFGIFVGRSASLVYIEGTESEETAAPASSVEEA